MYLGVHSTWVNAFFISMVEEEVIMLDERIESLLGGGCNVLTAADAGRVPTSAFRLGAFFNV